MKKLTFLTSILAVALLCACSNTVNYQVNVSGVEDGGTVTLTDLLSGDALETKECADGLVEFSGQADKNALLAVQKEDGDWQTMFFADGKPVSVNLQEKSLSGSELNEKLNACDKAATEAYESALKAIEEFGELTREEQEAKMEEIQGVIDGVQDSYKQILEDNSDNLIPAAFMPMLTQMLEREELDEVFSSKNAFTKHPYALKFKQSMDEYYAKMDEMEAAKEKIIGSQFIDLEEPDVDGNMHKLSEYVGQGKWVLIDFWASWCGPCRREMPNVVAAYNKYHSKGLEIVGLSFDNDKEAWVKAIKELEMPWIHLSDLKGWQTVASDTYNVKSIPASLLVNPEGVVVARDLRGDALGEKLSEVFGE